MAKKKPTNSPKPKEFHTKPFETLKGLNVAPPSAPEPVKIVKPEPVEEDDSHLFHQAMGGVRPIDSSAPLTTDRKAHVKQVSKPVEVTQVDQADLAVFTQAIGQLKLDVNFADKFPADDEIKPLGGNRLRQLKKGIIRVDRQLDLHGLTREEALAELPRFIRNARIHGEKAVLIITGKGNNSPAEPILQQAVAAWLRDAGKEMVSEFDSAPREMGGSGAFVVFLRSSS